MIKNNLQSMLEDGFSEKFARFYLNILEEEKTIVHMIASLLNGLTVRVLEQKWLPCMILMTLII